MSGVTRYKVGDVIGHRRLIERCGSDRRARQSLWRYECLLCGTIAGPVKLSTLTRRDAISIPRCCYDNNRHRGRNNPRWLGFEGLPKSYWNQCLAGARRRGLEFSITMQDMWEVFVRQSKRCALTGEKLTLSYKGGNASLDRIDSDRGYVRDNIQWVTKEINSMKSNRSQEEFIELCIKVARHAG